MNRGITKENLLLIAPPALRQDKSFMALLEAASAALSARGAEIDRARLYPNIDGLDEAVLDILAYDFKVDWWDPEYSLEEKRRTLKDSWRVHRKLGTKAAVERAIRAIYPETTVEPWFEYGGEPYHFRLRINVTSDTGDKVRQKKVLDRLNYYKSLRDHVDTIRYFMTPKKSWALAGGGFVGSRQVQRAHIPMPRLPRPGGRAHPWACTGVYHTYRRLEIPVGIPAAATFKGG